MTGKITQSPSRHYHVALFIETSQEFGRNVLLGIRDYERPLPAHWGFYLNPGGAMSELPRMNKWPCSGIIARVSTPDMARRLQKTGLPLVLLDPSSGILKPDVPAVPVVSTDTEKIVQMAAEHLLGCGCTAFAFVHSLHETVWSKTRAEAFENWLRAKGYPCHVFPVQGEEMSWEKNIRKLGRWLSSLPRQLGVFAAMDERGRHVIEACREAGLRVPEDVAVIGVDNDPLFCELCEPSLTSIALNAYGAGLQAASILHSLMDGRPVETDRMILVAPTHVSRRQSTAIGFDRDPLVSEARGFLFKQLSNPRFQIPDVAAHCGVSRRLLESRFEESTGKTLLQSITSIRMERACTLLRDSLDPVSAIASASGFADANYFTKAFRKHLGKSPLEYRESCRVQSLLKG